MHCQIQNKKIKIIPPSSLRKNPTSLNNKVDVFFYFKYFKLLVSEQAWDIWYLTVLERFLVPQFTKEL